MKLVVGLGNPGKKYEKTRHNVGFLAVDHIQKANNFSNWQLKKKLKSEIAENKEFDIVLTKPQTFMNNSGEAVALADRNWELETGNLIVIHDDFDLPIGTYKIEQGRSAAGHKGVRSIIDHLKTKDFWRLRIGIRPSSVIPTPPSVIPAEAKIQQSQIKAESFVLKNFSTEEKKIIQKAIEKSTGELLSFLQEKQ